MPCTFDNLYKTNSCGQCKNMIKLSKLIVREFKEILGCSADISNRIRPIVLDFGIHY